MESAFTGVQDSMFLPVSCDAPLYHLPYATVGLILANLAAFGAMVAGIVDPLDGWVLMYGQGMHPPQWLLSIFTHADPGHLISNMFFLWTFGIVTEGKLGWQRFLTCYLVIGIGESAMEQALMLGSMPGPGSLGASAAIYGLMAMACVWAPANDVKMVGFLGYFFFTWDVPIALLAATYVGIDLALTMWLGMESGESFMHLLGALLGAVLGTVLVKRRIVDCERWDLFTVLRGEQGQPTKEELAPPTAEQIADQVARRAQEARQKILGYLAIGQAPQALQVLRKARDLRLSIDLVRSEQLRLIAGLDQHKHWADAAPLMAAFIEQFPEGSGAVRLRLAQICLVELERPARALELLAPIAVGQLNEKQQLLHRQLTKVAQQRIEEGAMELDDVL
jgi:membrane associated rhomboid family serine protease